MELKVCSKCKVPKQLEDFYLFRNGRYSICVKCCQVAATARLNTRRQNGICVRCPNPTTKGNYCDGCRESENQRSRLRSRLTKKQCVEYKGGKCVDCSLVTSHLSVYDFHHIDPQQKDFSMNAKRSNIFENIKAELDKCVMLCSNCHRIRHELEGV